MAFTADPAELIAADVLAYLKAPARNFDTDILDDAATQILVPEDPAAELKHETQALRVLIIPVGGSASQTGRKGLVQADHLVNLIILAPLGATYTRAKLNGFAYAVRSSLRGEKMAGRSWSAEELLTKFDPDRLRQAAQYVSAFQVAYTGMER